MNGSKSLPFSANSANFTLSLFIGRANEILSAPEVVAKLIPITSAFELNSGPPEFPGFIGASV